MKIEPRRIEAFLRDPAAARLVLLHGEDHGLIRDRATALVKLIAGSIDDPFDVVELDRDAVGSLPAEMQSQSLTGRRRVIRIREAGDSAAEPVKRALAGRGGGFAILEAGSLTARSKLRALVEQAADAATIACYPLEGAAAAAIVTAALRDVSASADEDAVRWLCEAVVGDQAMLRREAEKLGLFVGAGARADLEATMLSVGDLSGLSIEDAVFAASVGDIGRADQAIETALAEGASAVGVLRVALSHFQRLLQARLLVDQGVAPSDAAKRLRPPPHFRRLTGFARALSSGTTGDFEAVLRHLGDTELACKRTGAPADALMRGALLAIARRAARGHRG
jgi:DNA polymerase-3 subunit delta